MVASSIAAAAVTCGVAKLVPSADAVLLRPAARVPLLEARRVDAAVSAQREGREDLLPGAAMSLNCASRFENAGEPPVAAERADAEHVRQRRGPARVRPRLRRRLVGVARPRRRRARPSRPRRRPRPPRAASTCRAPGSRRVAEAAEAHVDDAGAVRDRPADRLRLRLDRDRPLRPDDLGDEQLGRRSEPGDPDAVVRLGCDQARDERPVALGVDGGRAGDEALRRRDPAAQLRVRAVDAGVDHGHPHRRRAAAARSRRRTTGSAPRTTGAAGTGRSGRTTACAAPQPLDVARARACRAARGATARRR